MSSAVRIADRVVGNGAPCFVVAEAGVNHNGDPELASRLVHAAADAGADCVKFQMFRAEDVVSDGAPKAAYQLETTDPEQSQFDMLKALELPRETYPLLVDEAAAAGIAFLCTCYAEDELDYLDDLGVPAFKFASAQIVELPLLRYAARKGRPIIVSTGMATLDEIELAVEAIAAEGDPPVILLQCTTDYPAEIADANLRVISTLAAAFDVPVGYSDHTVGELAAVASVACGAALVEKHLTLDKALPGPDHSSSLEPDELAALVRTIREVEAALGSGLKEPSASERANARGMRRSLFAVTDIPAGSRIAREQLAMRRPNTGLPPSDLPRVIGATAKRDIAAGTPLTFELLTSEVRA
jgi:N,N'-diacetyllegionaminate synthase